MLEPDRIQVVTVAPADVPRTRLARWTCARCGRSFPVGDSWAVTHRTVRSDQVTAIVCPDCAAIFDPPTSQ